MFDAIDAAVRQVLSARGPMSEDDLLDALVADGVDLGRDAEATLAEALDGNADLVMPLADGRWASIPAVFDGRVFTHRLDEAEVAHDLIEWGPDLAPVSMLTELDAYRRLVDGSPISDAFALLDEDADAFAARGVPAAAIDGEGDYAAHPERFVRKPPEPPQIPETSRINRPDQPEEDTQ